MQAGTNSIVVTSDTASLTYNNGAYQIRVGKSGCQYYDGSSWSSIGSGGGTVTAKWG